MMLVLLAQHSTARKLASSLGRKGGGTGTYRYKHCKSMPSSQWLLPSRGDVSVDS
jgi:hypothetical protein